MQQKQYKGINFSTAQDVVIPMKLIESLREIPFKNKLKMLSYDCSRSLESFFLLSIFTSSISYNNLKQHSLAIL